MKKVLLILFVLAICVLAFPQGVMAADPQNVEVNANVVSSIDFTADNQMDNGEGGIWPLYYDATVYKGVTQGPTNTYIDAIGFGVTSNSRWDVNVYDETNAGLMKATESEVYLGDTIQVETDTVGNYLHVDDTSQVIANDGAPTGTTPETFARGLRQVVAWDDRSLVDDNYQITLTFECVPHLIP